MEVLSHPTVDKELQSRQAGMVLLLSLRLPEYFGMLRHEIVQIQMHFLEDELIQICLKFQAWGLV